MEEYKEITVNELHRTYDITHINVYIITQSFTVSHFTLSKIILIKFAKLRNFVLSFTMLLNLGAEGCITVYDNTSVGMYASDQQKIDS